MVRSMESLIWEIEENMEYSAEDDGGRELTGQTWPTIPTSKISSEKQEENGFKATVFHHPGNKVHLLYTEGGTVNTCLHLPTYRSLCDELLQS